MPNHFGPYLLSEKLGETDSHFLWKAQDSRLDRTVALQLFKQSDAEEMQKAKAACQLQHPNLALIYDASILDGVSFVAREYIEGSSLGNLLGSPMELGGLLRLGWQACRAVNHAHQKEIVHLDLRPENFLLMQDGQLKILGFGQVKASEPSVYSSPEQVLQQYTQQPLGPESDQFSLGILLFELATGKHPFQRESDQETMHAIVASKPSEITSLRNDLPEEFIRVIHRMLSKVEDDRFTSLHEVERVLKTLLGTSSASMEQVTRPTPPRKRGLKSVMILSSAALVLSCAGFGVYWLKSKGKKETVESAVRGRKVIALLPVEVKGIPPEISWLATGFQENINTMISRRSEYLVIPKEHVKKVWEDSQKALDKVLGKLGAEYLLTTELEGQGDKLTLTIKLLRGNRLEMVGQRFIHGEKSRILEMEDLLSQELRDMIGRRNSGNPFPRAKSLRTREFYSKGTELLRKGNQKSNEQAIKIFETAIQYEPDYTPLHIGLSEALISRGIYQKLNGNPGWEATFKKALEEAKLSIAKDNGTSRSYRIMAEALRKLAQYDEAKDAASKAVQLDPTNFRAYTILGDAYSYEVTPNRKAEAEKYYFKSIELNPTSWMAYYRLAVLYQHLGELEEAIKQCRIATDLQPDAVMPRIISAMCQLRLGRCEEAWKALSEADDLDPDLKLIHALQAIVAHRMKDQKSFLAHYAAIGDTWPEGYRLDVMLLGMKDLMEGRKEEARRRYSALLLEIRSIDWNKMPENLRRSASDSLVHMAGAMALHSETLLARELLSEAERLFSGANQIAKKDPILKKVVEGA